MNELLAILRSLFDAGIVVKVTVNVSKNVSVDVEVRKDSHANTSSVSEPSSN